MERMSKVALKKKRQDESGRKPPRKESRKEGDDGIVVQGEVTDAIKALAQLVKDIVPTAAVRLRGCDCKRTPDACPWTILGPQNINADDPTPFDIRIGCTAEGCEVQFGDAAPQPLAQGISGPFKGKLTKGQAVKVRYCKEGGGNAGVGYWPGSPPPAPPSGE